MARPASRPAMNLLMTLLLDERTPGRPRLWRTEPAAGQPAVRQGSREVLAELPEERLEFGFERLAALSRRRARHGKALAPRGVRRQIPAEDVENRQPRG